MRLFVDTGAWCGLYDRHDQYHRQAQAFANTFKKSPTQLITSDYILDETLTLLRARTGHTTAVAFGRYLMESKVVEIVEVSREVRKQAWEIFVKYEDKLFSFTDCTSFAVMEVLGINTAFAFDENFQQYGFLVKPGLKK